MHVFVCGPASVITSTVVGCHVLLLALLWLSCVQPENLMLVDDEQLKIIDFGLARKLTDNVECREMLGTPEFVGMSLYVCMSLSLYLHWNGDYGNPAEPMGIPCDGS